MLLKEEIIKLYVQYGFDVGEETSEYIVLLSKSGYFQNSEIVKLKKDLPDNIIDKQSYERLGYSVRIIYYENIDEANTALFRGFFNIRIANNKLLSEYHNFCLQQAKKLAGNSYEYIEGAFFQNGALQDNGLLSKMINIFSSDQRELIILEASAGFGKTCTSFEIICNLIEKFPDNIALLTELSKNRKASVFRYVLLSEIDQKFPTLPSDLVTHEIQKGRIFLIIDGFDELLSKDKLHDVDNASSDFKEAQTMLDTIAQLLPENSKTKILLTTRKSSIFVGEIFDQWAEKRLGDCNITRLQLAPPTLKNWIGPEKECILKNHGIEIDSLLNPVLLTILRNEPLDNFEQTYQNATQIINKYFELLIEREKTRQALLLEKQEQLLIMQNLAANMVQFDISSDDIDFIKEMILDIISPKIDLYLSRYDSLLDSSEIKPTVAEFADKLSHHALLDRISMYSNQIGFLNEFIFGLLIADSVINNILDPTELSGKYLDLAITSYSVKGKKECKILYNKIKKQIDCLTGQKRLNAYLNLLGTLMNSFFDEYIDGINFEAYVYLSKEYKFQDCIFSDCIFNNCSINTDAFKTCQFYNCSFYNVTIMLGEEKDCELSFFRCQGHEEFAKCAFRKADNEDESVVENYEQLVLEQFWKPGYEQAEPRRAYRTLLKGFSQKQISQVDDATKSLIKKGILNERVRCLEINFERMDKIKEILNR